MDTAPTVSIVVPIYNTAPWLGACLRSALRQEFPDFEVICVNDGSTDDSLKIAEGARARDGRIRIVTQANRGQGAARNAGLAQARGRFVYFLDSDDELPDPSMLGLLVRRMEEEALDLIFFDAETRFLEAGHGLSTVSYRRKKSYDGIFRGEDLFAAFSRADEFSVSPCLLMSRRVFLADNHILFPEDMKYEDNVFVLKTLFAATRVAYEHRILYTRIVRGESLMTQACTRRDVESYRACGDFVEELLRKSSLSRPVRGALRELRYQYRWRMRKMANSLGLDPQLDYPLAERAATFRRCLRTRGWGYAIGRLLGRTGK